MLTGLHRWDYLFASPWLGQPAPTFEVVTKETGPGELVAAGEILKMLGVGRSRFREIRRHPAFPAPYQELSVGAVWLKRDVERYIREHRPPRPADDDE